MTRNPRNKKAIFVVSILVLSVFALVPFVQAFNYSSKYGVYSLATASWCASCRGQDQNPPAGAGDGMLGPVTASEGGSDVSGDSASANATTNIATHNISGAATTDCVSSTTCYDNSSGYQGIGGAATGDMYDTYSASCSGTCPSTIDLEVTWNVTASFANAENGTCAQEGCPVADYSYAGYDSYIYQEILWQGSEYGAQPICEGRSTSGCMAEVYDYLQGWKYCQGGAEPSYYCPYSSPSQAGTTFVYSGTVDVSSFLTSICGSSCNISPSNPIKLEFINSIFAETYVAPHLEGVTLMNSTFHVFTDTPGVTITSAASPQTTTTSTTTLSTTTTTTTTTTALTTSTETSTFNTTYSTTSTTANTTLTGTVTATRTNTFTVIQPIISTTTASTTTTSYSTVTSTHTTTRTGSNYTTTETLTTTYTATQPTTTTATSYVTLTKVNTTTATEIPEFPALFGFTLLVTVVIAMAYVFARHSLRIANRTQT